MLNGEPGESYVEDIECPTRMETVVAHTLSQSILIPLSQLLPHNILLSRLNYSFAIAIIILISVEELSFLHNNAPQTLGTYPRTKFPQSQLFILTLPLPVPCT